MLLEDTTPGKFVLVDFFATWCSTCQTMDSKIEEFQAEIEDKMDVLKVDVDKQKQVATLFKVKSVPTYFLLKQGEVLWQHSGLITRRELKRILYPIMDIK